MNGAEQSGMRYKFKMKWARFETLYILCLLFCLALIEFFQLSWPAPPDPEPTAVEEVAIAIPPRPEGVRQSTESGDELSHRYTEAGCLAVDAQYRDICFHQLARQRADTDLDGGLAACAQIGKKLSEFECMSDVAELYAKHDRDRALEVCPTIAKKKWRDQCVFGIALAQSTLDPKWAFRVCDQSGQWRDFCRHDVNGEIAVMDSDLALTHCAAEEGDILTRKTCWHGIGKYIARVDVNRAFEACDKVPSGPDNLYRENCIHGLGWGASESRGADFVSGCQRAGAEKDSCLLGIAYNLKRFDVDAGLSICTQVERSELKAKCEAFVRE